MMVPRCEFGLCAVDGFLYAFGGWVGEDIGGSIEMYDPGLNEWRMQGKMQVCNINGILPHTKQYHVLNKSLQLNIFFYSFLSA